MAKGVRVIDKGLTQIIQRMTVAARGQSAAVGIQGNKGQLVSSKHGEMSNVELGAIHEYGTKDGHIPERSFLRSTFDKNQAKYQKELDEVGRKFFGLKNYQGELMLLGEKMKADVIETVKSGELRELAESTKARRKGETIALWNTGQLMNSLTSVLVYRDQIEGKE